MSSPSTVLFLRALSRLLGWIYTIAWSASFYPQPFLLHRRRSTTGSTLSHPLLNILGFIAYTLSTSLLLFSPLIRSQYASRNPVSPKPTVRGNDVAFAGHALACSLVVASMYVRRVWGFEQVGGKRVGRGTVGIVAGALVGVFWVVGRVLLGGGKGGWEWIDVVYALGYAKLVFTVTKYIPQAWLNYKRKSTVGWSIGPMLLDMIGGVLSVAQLVIDSSLQADWSGIAGNPVKFGLGNVSICFDLVFVVQHYWLYRRKGEDKVDDAESRHLLREDGEAVSGQGEPY